MINDHARKNIRAAMDRLLAGTPLRSDGTLTVLTPAAEADVKRHVLTHRHTDLKDEFYTKVRTQGRVPDSERKLRAELKKQGATGRADRGEQATAGRDRDIHPRGERPHH
ncbi:hypothetical protein [Streptomyces sp. R08]|uniref:Uncharacterized protein n=1 Tax=Streptomyces sp. R08 TaxID=3238624 RepID=A0AB39MQQ7_9ACTN